MKEFVSIEANEGTAAISIEKKHQQQQQQQPSSNAFDCRVNTIDLHSPLNLYDTAKMGDNEQDEEDRIFEMHGEGSPANNTSQYIDRYPPIHNDKGKGAAATTSAIVSAAISSGGFRSPIRSPQSYY